MHKREQSPGQSHGVAATRRLVAPAHVAKSLDAANVWTHMAISSGVSWSNSSKSGNRFYVRNRVKNNQCNSSKSGNRPELRKNKVLELSEGNSIHGKRSGSERKGVSGGTREFQF